MKYRYYIGRDNRKEQNKEHNTKKKGFRFLGSLDFIGATNRIRTYDPLITNEMLCQLSYSGKYSYIIFTRPIVVNTFFKFF